MYNAPNTNYEKFFQKFNEINTLPIQDWNYNHLIGYFDKLFRESYNTNYKWKFNSTAPSKCFEVFQMKRLLINISSDPVIAKQYLDWVFDKEVKKGKRKFTSISFINREEFQKQFKENFFKPIGRTTNLPDKYLSILNSYSNSIKTYGDLAFVYQANRSDPSFEEVLSQLQKLGFEEKTLQSIS